MSNLKCLIAVLVVSATLPLMATPLAGIPVPDAATNPLYAGQSFIFTGGGFITEERTASLNSVTLAPLATAGSVSYDHITFNFYSASTDAPYAVGTGYLFSQAYTGTPAQLSSSPAGLLGTATSDGSVYTFAPSLALTVGEQYFFYEDAPLQPLSDNSDCECDPSFASSGRDQPFTGPFPSLAYSVNGSPAPVTVTPEPSTLVLLCTGILAMAGAMRRRVASIHA